MTIFLTVLHVMVCLVLVVVVLLQHGKGADIGAVFGGGASTTVFGSRGPGTFLSKVTVAAAIVFMFTSLGLAILSKERAFSSTVIDVNKKESSATPDHTGNAGHETPATGTTTTPTPEPAKP